MQSFLGGLDLFLILFGFLPGNFWISYQYIEDDGDARSVDVEQSFAGRFSHAPHVFPIIRRMMRKLWWQWFLTVIQVKVIRAMRKDKGKLLQSKQKKCNGWKEGLNSGGGVWTVSCKHCERGVGLAAVEEAGRGWRRDDPKDLEASAPTCAAHHKCSYIFNKVNTHQFATPIISIWNNVVFLLQFSGFSSFYFHLPGSSWPSTRQARRWSMAFG